MGDFYRGFIKGATRSLDYSSCTVSCGQHSLKIRVILLVQRLRMQGLG